MLLLEYYILPPPPPIGVRFVLSPSCELGIYAFFQFGNHLAGEMGKERTVVVFSCSFRTYVWPYWCVY